MKIPTLLALALLIIAISLGLGVYYLRDTRAKEQEVIATPENIQIANITSSSLSILWQTDVPTTGLVVFGKDKNLSRVKFSTITNLFSKEPSEDSTRFQQDIREAQSKKPQTTHFVTINNLSPNSKYFYQIKSNGFRYPKIPAQVLTPNEGSLSGELNQPVRGTVITSNLQGADGALVILQIQKASLLANVTGKSGNFIIPTKDLLTEDLRGFYEIKEGTEGLLKIIMGGLKSEVKLTFAKDLPNLPPITLGQNYDLKDISASSSAEINIISTSKSFDLNGDGKINSLDRSLVIQRFGQGITSPADFNNDQVVDEKDLDLLREAQLKQQI